MLYFSFLHLFFFVNPPPPSLSVPASESFPYPLFIVDLPRSQISRSVLDLAAPTQSFSGSAAGAMRDSPIDAQQGRTEEAGFEPLPRESDPDEAIEPLIRAELAKLREAAARWRVSASGGGVGGGGGGSGVGSPTKVLRPAAFEKVRQGRVFV